MSEPMLIGLTGYAGSGKDTVAAVLHEQGFAWATFGLLVRDECAAAWRVSDDLFLDRAEKDSPQTSLALAQCSDEDFVRYHQQFAWTAATPREVMQLWGDFQRSRDHWHYVDKMAEILRRFRLGGFHRIVISDVRLPIEARWVEGQLGRLWRVVRPGVGPTNQHPTETALDRWPIGTVLVNQFDLEHLRRLVVDLLQTRSTTTTA